MDILRERSRDQMTRIPFRNAESHFDVLQGLAYPSGSPTVARGYTIVPSIRDLRKPLPKNSAGEPPSASFRLIHLGFRRQLQGSPAIAKEIFSAFNIDQYYMQFVTYSFSGFFHLCSETHHSYYFSTRGRVLIWSFNEETLETRALYTCESSIADNFLQMIEPLLAKGYFDNPMMPALVFADYLLRSCWHNCSDQYDDITLIENRTGHQVIMLGDEDMPEKQYLKDPIMMSQSIGRSQGILVVCMESLRVAQAALTHSNEMADHATWQQKCPEPWKPRQKASLAPVKEALVILQQRAEYLKMDLNTLQERAKNQHSVLFNLIAREDAKNSLAIAEAAKRDSSSMKTVAVMTMAFLPGTFFAALFAVPSLQWTAANVVGPRFWVYWAFTLPCTALVFAFWVAITTWGDMVALLKQFIYTKPRGPKSANLSNIPAEEKELRTQGVSLTYALPQAAQALGRLPRYRPARKRTPPESLPAQGPMSALTLQPGPYPVSQDPYIAPSPSFIARPYPQPPVATNTNDTNPSGVRFASLGARPGFSTVNSTLNESMIGVDVAPSAVTAVYTDNEGRIPSIPEIRPPMASSEPSELEAHAPSVTARPLSSSSQRAPSRTLDSGEPSGIYDAPPLRQDVESTVNYGRMASKPYRAPSSYARR